MQQSRDGIMRIKDNCKSFDPLERTELLEKEGEYKNFGIRLVNSTAKEVQYQNLLGLNVLTIRN